MKTVELIEPEKPAAPSEVHAIIKMPFGLLGFERVKNYMLIANPADAPFMWLQMMEGDRKSFLVVSPFLVLPEYAPDLPNQDVEFLDLKEPSDAMVLNIVTLRQHGKSTLNLRGPVIVNRHTFVAKQVIPDNGASYSVSHPLPGT